MTTAVITALAFASPAMAISPSDETAILNPIEVSFAPGVREPASVWRIARWMRVHEPSQVTIESLTEYSDVVDLAFAHLELKLTPLAPTAFEPAWLIRLSNVRNCSIRDPASCFVGTAWAVLTIPEYAFVESGSP